MADSWIGSWQVRAVLQPNNEVALQDEEQDDELDDDSDDEDDWADDEDEDSDGDDDVETWQVGSRPTGPSVS